MSRRKIVAATVPLLLGCLAIQILSAQGGSVQRVYPSPERQTRPASSSVAVDVFFTTGNNVAAFTGLGLRIFWDSRKLTFQPPTNLLNAGLQGAGEPEIDTGDADGDPATDRFILIAWFDNNMKWPGQVPIRLFTLNFSTVASFAGSTSIRFTSRSVMPGYDFDATPAVVESGTGLSTTTLRVSTTTITSTTVRITTTSTSTSTIRISTTTTTTQRATSTTITTTTSTFPTTTSTTVPQSPGEPRVALTLPVNPALGCPGFYIADVALAPGARSGIWGVEVLVSAGEKLLQGGLNMGGAFEADGRNNAWGAFNIVNPRSEPQIVRVRIDAQALPTPSFDPANFGVDVRIVDSNRNPVGGSITGRPPLSMERTLNPGFFIVEVRSLARSPQGTFQLAAETSFVDRAGGGFQGGAVVGGFLSRDAAGNSLHGYAAVCISEAQQVTFKTYGTPAYGSGGAGDLILTVYDWNRQITWQSPVPSTTSTTSTTTTTRRSTTTISSTTTTTRAIPPTTTTTTLLSVPGYAWDVALAGNYAYVAYGSIGLRIFNIANPAYPVDIGGYDTPGYAWGIAVAGSYAYVADGESGLRIVNVSNPSAPFEVGFIDTPGIASGVTIAGNYAYVADFTYGLRIVDISNPRAPTEAGYFDTYWSRQVTLSGSLAFVANDSEGFQIINVSNPKVPVLVGSCATPETTWELAVAGGFAYVADGTKGLRIVDVRNPAAPATVGSWDTPGEARGVDIAGVFAYVADWDGGMRVINVSNPAAPVEVGSYSTRGLASDLVVSGNYAYVAAHYSGLQSIQVGASRSITMHPGISTTANIASWNMAGFLEWLCLKFAVQESIEY